VFAASSAKRSCSAINACSCWAPCSGSLAMRSSSCTRSPRSRGLSAPSTRSTGETSHAGFPALRLGARAEALTID
jgi:hypothetical protein